VRSTNHLAPRCKIQNIRDLDCGLLRARNSSPTVEAAEVSVFEAYTAVSGNSNRSLSQLDAMKNVTFPKDCQQRHSKEDSVH